MEKHVVYIPKIGTWIDGGIGGFEVDERYQERKIEEVKEQWKKTISCKLSLVTELVSGKDEDVPHFEYKFAPNPYYGWKESQLEIIIK